MSTLLQKDIMLFIYHYNCNFICSRCIVSPFMFCSWIFVLLIVLKKYSLPSLFGRMHIEEHWHIFSVSETFPVTPGLGSMLTHHENSCIFVVLFYCKPIKYTRTNLLDFCGSTRRPQLRWYHCLWILNVKNPKFVTFLSPPNVVIWKVGLHFRRVIPKCFAARIS